MELIEYIYMDKEDIDRLVSQVTSELVATQPYEARIDMLVRYIADHDGLLTNRLAVCHSKELPGFVYLTLPFTAPQYRHNWTETIHILKQSGCFTLRNGLLPGEYNPDDSYYKSNKFDSNVILLNMNLQNMTVSIGTASPLACWIRVMGGTDLDLGVFGRVRQLADSLYQIEPYAVWRT